MSYNHAEAFCLMKYAADDGSEVEWIWNSRDGVTPFGVANRARTTILYHVDWQLDRRIPNYQPQKCERIFVDLTPERAEQFAQRRIEQYWDDGEYPMKEMFASRVSALAELVKGMLQRGAPDTIEARDWKR